MTRAGGAASPPNGYSRVLTVACGALLLALAIAGASGAIGPLRSASVRPNVLLVTLDTVRADRIGAYGYTRGRTPHLDGIARRGVRFADATTNAPLTGPAHAALLTGLYPSRLGVRDNASVPLAPDAVTLAEVFAAADYATGAFIGAFVLDRPYGFAQGFGTFESGFARVDSGHEAEVQRRGDAVVNDALEWLSARPAGRPFFAWVHLYDAHAPYEPPAPFGRDFTGRPYDGEVAFVDAQVGRLLDRLRASGQIDSTIVVAVADHGEALGDHGEQEHGLFLYEGVLRIPWVMAGPGVPAGRIVTEQVRAIDLAPTMAELVGLDLRSHLDGESVGALIRGGSREEPSPSLAETYYGQLHFGTSELRSLRDGAWKAIDAPRPELYDLRTDAAEQRNLVSQRQALASGMMAAASRLAAGFGGASAAQTQPSPETLERLRSLGYVGIAARPPGSARGSDPKDVVGQFEEYRRLTSVAVRDLRAGRAAAAARTLRRLIAMNDRAYDLHLFLGDAYRELRRFDEALGEYAAAATLNPESAVPLAAAAEAHLGRGDAGAARLSLEEAARREAQSFDVAFARGLLLEQEQRWADALVAYERAIGLNGANPRPRARLASVAARLGRYDVAEAQLRALLAMEYQPSRTHVGLGRVAESKRKPDEAAAHYREALKLEPGLQMALDGLKRVGRQ